MRKDGLLLLCLLFHLHIGFSAFANYLTNSLFVESRKENGKRERGERETEFVPGVGSWMDRLLRGRSRSIGRSFSPHRASIFFSPEVRGNYLTIIVQLISCVTHCPYKTDEFHSLGSRQTVGTYCTCDAFCSLKRCVDFKMWRKSWKRKGGRQQ